jgi:hypothetical protein
MSIADSENAAQVAVSKTNAIIARWKAFAIDQHVIDLANKYLGPAQANEMIAAARAGLVELDLDNQLAALASTLEKI